ncbi:hypothetical protein ACFPFV_07655 [Salinicoccus siamensis]|uniref:hypothetical protein n=1 Tax=Salinicoccus siamensis TaxID=381830 RepID=UPI00360ED4A5
MTFFNTSCKPLPKSRGGAAYTFYISLASTCSQPSNLQCRRNRRIMMETIQ